MSAGLLESIYNGAASIAKPLSLAALIATFLMLIMRQVVKALERPLANATSQDSVRVVLSILRYLFTLSLIALVGGLASYMIEFFLQDYVKKYSLIDSARAAMALEDPREINKFAQQLIDTYPEYAEGYHYRGIGNFYARNYTDAAKDFAQALKYISHGSEICDEKRRDFTFNHAAAQAASGQHAAGLQSMKSMEACWSEKSELFNYGKILMMNGEFASAWTILNNKIFTDNQRPDYISRIWLERGILSMVEKGNGWIDRSIECFKKAIIHNRDFTQIIICGVSSDKIEPPGMVEDYEFELSVMKDSLNEEYVTFIRSKLMNIDLCNA